MKVLHLTAGKLYGGIETYLLTLARLRHLCPEMEPHFGVCFPGRLQEELVAAGVSVYELGAVRVSRPWTVLRARWRLRRILRDTKFDVAITHGSWPHVVFAPEVKRAGVRLVYAVHGQLDRGHWLNRWAARTPPDAIVANSYFTADSARFVFPNIAATVVYPPVLGPIPVDRDEVQPRLRAECNTALDAVVVLIVSRIEQLKGHAVLLDALGRLRDVEGWVCWIVGGAQRPHEVELLRELQATARQLGITERVRFLGQRSDVPAVMAAADIYCQTNTGPEGFGLTFVEALRAGLPVITTNIGGAAEIVTPDCGILCPPGDARAVAAALRELITDPDRRQRLARAGPARASTLCDPRQRIPELANVITITREQLPCSGGSRDR